MSEALFMGIDAGTQGVRAVVADENGQIVAAKSVSYERMNAAEEPDRYEQSPADWWSAAERSVRSCTSQIRDKGLNADSIASISIDGTSGTILALDSGNKPLHNAIMYNDMRAGREAARASLAFRELEKKLGLRYGASFSLARVLWIRENMPQIYDRTARFVHHADYLCGKLCGEYAVSDYSNALKTGYDLINDEWPASFSALDIDVGKLPGIVAPGTPVAKVSASAADNLGLSRSTLVVGGSTDGYASALAAGATKAGDWASIIGTTLVLKGVTGRLLIDPTGSAYSHLLPSGAWLLGGASNVGGRCLNHRFDPEQFAGLNETVDALSPTGALTYPLTGVGERFPFVDPDAREFICGSDTSDPRVLYAALMEGVGYVERLTYERMTSMGCAVGDVIHTSGGACRSVEWLRIRASILNKQLKVPSVVDAAMGSAMLAASGWFGSLEKAVEAMLRFEKSVDPVSGKTGRFDDLYHDFRRECYARFALGADEHGGRD